VGATRQFRKDKMKTYTTYENAEIFGNFDELSPNGYLFDLTDVAAIITDPETGEVTTERMQKCVVHWTDDIKNQLPDFNTTEGMRIKGDLIRETSWSNPAENRKFHSWHMHAKTIL